MISKDSWEMIEVTPAPKKNQKETTVIDLTLEEDIQFNHNFTQPPKVNRTRVEELEQALQILQEENEKLKNRTLCIICAEREQQVILLPCKHQYLCTRCAYQVNQCPVCRCTISERCRPFRPI